MQAAATGSSSISRRRSHNEGLVEDAEQEEAYNKLDRLAESSHQATAGARRLSASHREDHTQGTTERRMSKSNGANTDHKGKGRLLVEENGHLNDEPEAEAMKAESEAESLYDSDDESMHCSICLSIIEDRTVVQPCCHDAYCFVCILAWTEQSRRCPLCVANIDLLIHNIRSEKDYQKHYLPPLLKSDSPPPERSFRELREGARRQLFNRPTHPRFKYSDWKARNRPAQLPDVDAEDLALEKRRYVYKYGLYVKHVASNRYTRFRDYSAQQVSTTPELKQRLAKWFRRELRVFDGVDLAFLVDYCTNIASQLELRSDSATRLLAEFLGEEQAEHFWHETYSFLRSPYKDIRQYDKAVQYDRPPCKIDEAKQESESRPKRPLRRRPRSRSVPSSSDASSISDRPPRRHSRRESARRREPRRDSPPRRATGDSYIPSYSRLNEPRRPARKRRDRRPSRSEPVRGREGFKQRQWGSDEKSQVQQTGINDVGPKVAAPPVESDIEDQISLGESYHEDDAPTVATDAPHSSNDNPTQGEARPAALSIRGIAQVKSVPNGNRDPEVDLIRDLGPDLLSRLSGGTGVAAQAASPSRLQNSQTGSSNGIQKKGRGFRKGIVNSEMHATLMARLNEEKLRSANIPSASSFESLSDGREVKEKTEASLREHVLQVLKQRREQNVRAAKPAVPSEQMERRQTGDTVDQNGNAPDSKSSKLLLLQKRLAQERAAISPTIPSAASIMPEQSVTPTEGATAASPPASGDAAARMAELKKRLAEQKANKQKA